MITKSCLKQKYAWGQVQKHNVHTYLPYQFLGLLGQMRHQWRKFGYSINQEELTDF